MNCWPRDMIKFDFSKKGQELVSSQHFVYDFSRKLFLMLYSINWANLIVWLPLILEISGNLCILIVCYPVCDVVNFKIIFAFLLTRFPDQQSRAKIEIPQKRKELLRCNKKQLSSFLKNFQLLEIVSDLGVPL